MPDGRRTLPAEPSVIKACCVSGYQSDLVALILGDSYHPGGAALTRRLAETVSITPGDEVLDVASGPGSTALLLAAEFGASVVGVDLGVASVDGANARATKAGVDGRGPGQARFLVGDAERLPFSDTSLDVVVSECALCTFPNKDVAASEMARVLRPGGRVGLTDVVIETDQLDPELADIAGWVACLADARPVDGYREILVAAGLDILVVERHDQALVDMVDDIEARISILAMTQTASLAQLDVTGIQRRLRLVRRAIADGIAGYALIVASRR